MDLKSFASAIEQICEEKGIVKERVMETIEMALAAAYKKEYGHKGQNIRVKLVPETGAMQVFQVKLVVEPSMLKVEPSMLKPEEEETTEEIKKEAVGEKETEEKTKPEKEKSETETEEEKKIRFNPEKHILIKEAKKLKDFPAKTIKKLKPGDELEFPLEVHEDYGRIAAQTAKQVIIQRIREAERESIYEEYKDKKDQLISGIVQRLERGNAFLDIGKAVGIIFPEEQIPGERYRLGQRLRAYLVEVKKDVREPLIILSRTHPKIVSQLFGLEVPEISAGTVEIKSISREPGSRTKIAVSSNNEKVDPIGSMIGQRGSRVQAVINELAGEKIDIVEWSDDPVKFISYALSPAKVVEVKINQEKNEARVLVPPDQLSLAIGAKGQNVRLAARLTGWKIDIEPIKEEKEEAAAAAEKKKTKKEKIAGKESETAKTKEKKSKKKKEAERGIKKKTKTEKETAEKKNKKTEETKEEK